ncbi:MAG: hypothetical protein LBC96_00430 [Lachnospiraceae bacterium]|jgi:hypothetical protein|nr:hypothetical protein [Lachnospiraceae bacterium]
MSKENKEASNKKRVKAILPYLIGAAIGFVIGFFTIYGNNPAGINPADTNGENGGGFAWDNIILPLVYLFISVIVAFFLHVILHEAGHLLGGLISGYGFVSFTIANIMFIKEDNGTGKEKLRIKRFAIAGVGGQCLMSPPPQKNGSFPFMFYNNAGGLTNLIASFITVGLYFALKDSLTTPIVIFLPFVGIGVLLGITNLLPLKLGGISTDGYNIKLLKKCTLTRDAFWLLLSINAKLSLGGRSKDFPAEWFMFADDYDFNNAILGNVAVFGLNRLLDCHDFTAAKLLAKRILEQGSNLIMLLRNETLCELLFLELISEHGEQRTEEITRLYTPELKQYIAASKTQLSKHRLIYAYEKLFSEDSEKAAKAFASFEKVCRRYPYSGDRECERELVKVVDALAQ